MNRTLENPNLYSITISPPYRPFDPVFLYNDDLPIIIRWFRKFSKHFILFTEITESDSRIHYHGTIDIHDLIKFHRTRCYIHKSLGFIKIKRLVKSIDLLRWTFYIRKEYFRNGELFPFIIHLNKTKIKKIIFKNNPMTIMECFHAKPYPSGTLG